MNQQPGLPDVIRRWQLVGVGLREAPSTGGVPRIAPRIHRRVGLVDSYNLHVAGA